MLLSLLTGLVFGVMPAVNATRLDGHGPSSCVTSPCWRRPLVWPSAPRRRADCAVPRARVRCRLPRAHTPELQQVPGGFSTENILVAALDANDTTFPHQRMVELCSNAVERLANHGRGRWLVLDHEPGGYSFRKADIRDSDATLSARGEPGIGQRCDAGLLQNVRSRSRPWPTLQAQDTAKLRAWPSSTKPRHASTSAAPTPSAVPSRSGTAGPRSRADHRRHRARRAAHLAAGSSPNGVSASGADYSTATDADRGYPDYQRPDSRCRVSVLKWLRSTVTSR